MSYLLFFFWLILLCWCLGKIKFVQQAGLGKRFMVAIFLCKVAAGMLMGRMTEFTLPMVDTWGFHTEGLAEYRLLFSNPGEYVVNLFHSIYPDQYGGLFAVNNSYWNDLRNNIMFKIVSVFHIFSFGHYYVNVILFNFLTLFGSVALFRFLKQAYSCKPEILAAAVFLLPSLLLYSSTLHKDGIVLATIGGLLYTTRRLLDSKPGWSLLLLTFTGFVFLFLFRNLAALCLLPALFALVLCYKLPFKPLIVFTVVYVIGLGLFFIIPNVAPAFNFPGFIVQRQADFLGLAPANTLIPVNLLHPTFTSFAANAPQALLHSLTRPFFPDVALSKLLLPFVLELLGYGLLILTCILFKKKTASFNHPITVFGYFFSISICLVIGYTVPILGAIVRYRAIYLPFLLAPFLCNTDWLRIWKLMNIKK